jgi:hypothetical protein
MLVVGSEVNATLKLEARPLLPTSLIRSRMVGTSERFNSSRRQMGFRGEQSTNPLLEAMYSPDWSTIRPTFSVTINAP